MTQRAARVALLGAFPYPVPQGSQAYVGEQARALGQSGAEVTLICYGSGVGAAPEAIDLVRVPRILSPRRLRAGMSPVKPVADAALLATLLRAHAARRFDVVLAHNLEAAAVGLAARPLSGIPVVYVAHTLWRHELPTYAPAPLRSRLEVLGRQLDSIAARGADAVLALSSHAARVLGASARGPVEAIPPGLETRRHPRPEAVAQVCARHALAAGRYVVYAGNLDAYQELPLLEAAAERLPEVVFAAVTHDPRGPALSRVQIATVADRAEARALVHGAAVAVLPRRIPGGFPVKLLNYMEAERPIVAFEEVAEGHVHGQSAWLLSAGAGPDDLASAVRALLNDPARAQRLGREARTLLESRHAWPPLARRTLALAERARERRHRGRG